jgi:3-phosphoglycerate kinase
MDATLKILVLLLIVGGVVFFIFAWAKGWLKGAGRGSFTSQVIMHDMLDKSKQKAMEYVIDKEGEKEKKDALSGKDKKPEDEEEGDDES